MAAPADQAQADRDVRRNHGGRALDLLEARGRELALELGDGDDALVRVAEMTAHLVGADAAGEILAATSERSGA